MNIIPFESKSGLPAYLKRFDVSALNADLTAHAGGGFPVLSIKGKRFAVVRDGERTTLMNPKDPESPATHVDLVLLKVGRNKSKVFYLKGYDPKESEGQKPDCYSSDGVAPAADATAPQAKSCATCVHNQWGSRITDKGASKGKACNDTVRMAVAAAGHINDPMLLRVPPASIRSLGEYGQLLAKRGVGYNMVVTKVSFDSDAESQKLVFRPVGLLDEASFEQVQETADSDVVRDILGTPTVAVAVAHEPSSFAEPAEEVTPAVQDAVQEVVRAAVSKAKRVTDDEVQSAVAAALPAKSAAQRKPADKPVEKPADKPPAAAAAQEVEDDFDVDLDGINFDDV